MGIPGFARWIMQRYPLVVKRVATSASEKHENPVIDELYIDMNGVIHQCAHPDKGRAPSSDREMEERVRMHLARVVSMVNPTTLLMISFDGVAPRAKMNQQRCRRFHAVKERREQKRRDTERVDVKYDRENVEEHGADDDDEERERRPPPEPSSWEFDSNSITPGTRFMLRMYEVVVEFVRVMVQGHPQWQSLHVVVSGASDPGEGEHKIMHCLRKNEHAGTGSVCIYGLDADLVVLGLVLHIPFVCILREDVYLGKQDAHGQWVDYQFVHLNVLREYLEMEFLGDVLPLPQSQARGDALEQVLDDLAFITMLVGSDFLPRIPCLYLKEGALDVMFEKYRQLRESGEVAHLVLGPRICAPDMRAFIHAIREHEEEAMGGDDAVWQDGLGFLDQEDWEEGGGVDEEHGDEGCDDAATEVAGGGSSIGDREVLCSSDFNHARSMHYIAKLKCTLEEVEEMAARMADEYLDGLLWTLRYYHETATPSWDWFYPFHYGPLAYDLELALSGRSVEDDGCIHGSFPPSEPWHAASQLLCVLPTDSRALVPQCLQPLMSKDEENPLREYFPDCEEIHLDTTDCRYEWEGVYCVPFVSATHVQNAVAAQIERVGFTEEEERRCSFVPTVCITRSGEMPLDRCRLPSCRAPEEHRMLYRLMRFPCAGFPTLRAVPVQGHLAYVGVTALKRKSQWDSMLVTVGEEVAGTRDVDVEALRRIGDRLVGKCVFTGVPYLRPAIVVSVSTRTHRAMGSGWVFAADESDEDWERRWKVHAQPLKGTCAMVFAEPVHVVCAIRPLSKVVHEGRKKLPRRVWSKVTISVPLAGIAESCRFYDDPRLMEADGGMCTPLRSLGAPSIALICCLVLSWLLVARWIV